MSDVDDRLAALDPAAGQPYEHRNLDALISRITTEPRRAARRLWRNIEIKIAGTLVVGSLIAASTIALVQGAAPTLPALAMQKAAGTKFAVAAQAPEAGPMQPYAEYVFSGGLALSTRAPHSPSYRLAIPGDASQEAGHLAGVFGVDATPLNSNGDGSDWLVKSESGAAFDYENTGVPQWYFSSTSPAIAPAMSSSAPVNPLPSEATVAADAQRYLAQMGFSYGLSSPNFSTSTTSSVAANGTSQLTSSTEDVVFDVNVDGVATDQTVSFSVGEDNVLAHASGPAFHLDKSYGYPLESPAAGVRQLNAAQKTKFSSSNSVASPPPVIDVALSHDSITLQTYELTDATWWLLPVYRYRGAYSGTSGVASTGTWDQLAIDPTYVQINNTSTSASTP
ncbi:MAG: hypothetical protein JWM55_1924 [Acidimicrobiaceae bacterium]|nr:hypothetical protein [Acidimicrobiaceae bacterium]